MKQSQETVPFMPKTSAAMHDDAVVKGDHWRIGILTDSMLRLEWSDEGEFEDLPTQVVWNRSFQSTPRFTVTRQGELTIIDTDALHVVYDGKPFSREGLSVVVKGVDSQFNTWHFGDEDRGNLGGTARTLDEADGDIPLERGVCSRDGWAVIDDSASNVIAPADSVQGEANPYGSWVFPRKNVEKDFYFFGYGHHFKTAVRDFYALTGRTPLLPRFVFGNWWSRFYKYTADEYITLMNRFAREGLPFTTAVIDMDWHIVDVDPKYGSGWTGYTWNRELFPDPKRFLADLHERGMQVTLNVHPRDGIRAFEDGYEKAAKSLGVDVKRGDPVDFDLTRPRFAQTYFDLHHNLEDEGVDFWWLDWQQGGVTRLRGLDPLWMLNHMHFLDSGRDGRWPLTFSRYAGPGSHRYPIGFSGDTVVSWDSLRFQPYFTATASNIGYGWWSHDIGGHMCGSRDEELEARWYQLGAFSPINRLHSSASSFNTKEPWHFRAEVRLAMNDALRFRQCLVPYLYTMNWRAAYEGAPLVEPMYWQDAEADDAYTVPNEFRFGTQLIVAPVTEPGDADSHLGGADVWFPHGMYFDFFDGRRYAAGPQEGRRMRVWRPLNRIPVFAKAGSIIPLQMPVEGERGAWGDPSAQDARTAQTMQTMQAVGEPINSVANPDRVELLVFPGDNGSFVLREDAGRFPTATDMDDAAEQAGLAETPISLEWLDDRAVLTIHAAQQAVSSIPAKRQWTVTMRGVEPTDVEVLVDGHPVTCESRYDAGTSSTSVTVEAVDVGSTIQVRFTSAEHAVPEFKRHDPHDEVFRILQEAQMPNVTKEKALAMADSEGAACLAGLRSLNREKTHRGDLAWSHMPESVLAAIEEVMLCC